MWVDGWMEWRTDECCNICGLHTTRTLLWELLLCPRAGFFSKYSADTVSCRTSPMAMQSFVTYHQNICCVRTAVVSILNSITLQSVSVQSSSSKHQFQNIRMTCLLTYVTALKKLNLSVNILKIDIVYEKSFNLVKNLLSRLLTKHRHKNW